MQEFAEQELSRLVTLAGGEAAETQGRERVHCSGDDQKRFHADDQGEVFEQATDYRSEHVSAEGRSRRFSGPEF